MGTRAPADLLSLALRQPSSDGAFDAETTKTLRALGQRRRLVMFAFAPKAAGTFLRSAAIKAVDGQLVRIVHAQGGRDAQPYLPTLLSYFSGGVTDKTLVTHVHLLALPGSTNLLRAFGIRPIVMLRSIPDMLVSYADMLDAQEDHGDAGINFPIPPDFKSMKADRRADFLIDIVAPWYVSHFATWRSYSRLAGSNVHVAHFSDFVADPVAVLQAMLNHVEIPRSRSRCVRAMDEVWEIRHRLRFNKGQEGRGAAAFSAEHIGRLSRMMSYYPVLRSWQNQLLGISVPAEP